MNSYEEAKIRMPSQRVKILNALRNAGKSGLTNLDLLKISPRWSARIQELYVQGYQIDTIFIKKGVYLYVLDKEPVEIQSIKSTTKAVDILVEVIRKDYNGTIKADQLVDILDEEYLQVVRKPDYYKMGL